MSPAVLATADQVARATGGRVAAGAPTACCTAVSTDSRAPVPGSLFVALRGENFDGARFCADAVRGGSTIVLVEEASLARGLGDVGAAAVVAVSDSLRALGELAAWHRARFEVRVVAVTGSNGKTSTKEMITAVLGGPPAVLHTRGNFNNQVGMPRALLGLDATHRYVVAEMGMNAPGEISALARIARPQVGVITNVHPVHLEGLGSLDAVARAKGELFEALPQDGVAVVNTDDAYALKQLERTRAGVLRFGRANGADARVEGAAHAGDGLDVSLRLRDETVRFHLARPGLHNAMNAAAAAAVGLAEGLVAGTIAERLAQAPLPALRMERLVLGEGCLLVDCYNANPRSVQAAVKSLVELAADGKRFALLGDMKELGASSTELHWQTGHLAAESGLDAMATFGELARDIARGAREAGLGEVISFDSIPDAIDWVEHKLAGGGCVLLKGSRAMRLERIARALAGKYENPWGLEAGE